MMMKKCSVGVKPKAAPRSIQCRAEGGAARPLWFPGNAAPAHLDGTLAGDFGFDPLSLGADKENLRWFVQAELVHCRWAMLGVAGILWTGIGAANGAAFPQWYEAGEVALKSSSPPAAFPFIATMPSFGALVFSQLLLFGWVETKRWYDFNSPGSQGAAPWLGFPPLIDASEFKGTENGYPGGKFFDPLGIARGDPAMYNKYKWNEVRNGRLAMVALVGFVAQYKATGKGPIQNLADHLADPFHTTFTTNGVSLPPPAVFV